MRRDNLAPTCPGHPALDVEHHLGPGDRPSISIDHRAGYRRAKRCVAASDSGQRQARRPAPGGRFARNRSGHRTIRRRPRVGVAVRLTEIQRRRASHSRKSRIHCISSQAARAAIAPRRTRRRRRGGARSDRSAASASRRRPRGLGAPVLFRQTRPGFHQKFFTILNPTAPDSPGPCGPCRERIVFAAIVRRMRRW